jgi:hypothetical protein
VADSSRWAADSSPHGGTECASEESVPSRVAAALPALAQQLAALDQALCAQFPLPYCCNNPGCVELRGASGLQLVGGKGSVCSRCRWVRWELLVIAQL